MVVDVETLAVDVSGNITYESEEERTISPFGDVNVVTVHGTLSGAEEMFGEPFLAAAVTMDGFLYEAANGVEIYEMDTHMLIDATIGSDSGALSIQNETQTVEVYTPAYLAGFNPEWLPLGDEYIFHGDVNKTVTTWETGTLQRTSSSKSSVAFDIYIWPTTESVVTPMGRFDTLRIDIGQDDDNEIRWWSDEVIGYVKIEFYVGNGAVAHDTMILTSYEKGNAGSMGWIAIFGVAFTLATIVALAVVLLRIRHPKSS